MPRASWWAAFSGSTTQEARALPTARSSGRLPEETPLLRRSDAVLARLDALRDDAPVGFLAGVAVDVHAGLQRGAIRGDAGHDRRAVGDVDLRRPVLELQRDLVAAARFRRPGEVGVVHGRAVLEVRGRDAR